MKNQVRVLFLFVLVLSAQACANVLKDFSCPLDQTVKQGLNAWKTKANGVDRVFHADFPRGAADKAVGVIFSWHGVGDNIENWRTHVPFADYSTADFPYIVVTPHDTGLSAIWGGRRGLAWDLFKSNKGDDNLEAALFESVLGCLSRSHKIDDTRVYSAGFSGGAIVSNMLHARYPQIVSAIFSGSGAWMNDDAQRDSIHIPFGLYIEMAWAELAPQDSGAVLMSFGGDADSFGALGLEIVNFHKTGTLAKDYLRKHNRTSVVCEHDGAHHFHPAMRIRDIVKFFRLHSAGKPSPIKTTADLPPALRGSCSVVVP